MALDDAVVKFMVEEAGYSEDHSQMNLKLLVYFILNVVGTATGYYSWKTPFEKSKFWTAIGSGTFLLIYIAWNVYHYVTVQYIFSGKKELGKCQLVRLRSSIQLKDPVYRILATADGIEKEIIAKRVDSWITEDGFVAARPFLSDMQMAGQKIGNFKKD